MSEHEIHEVPEPEAPQEDEEQPQAVNLMEQLRAQRQEALDDTSVDLPLPSNIYSDPIVLVRYRMVDARETQRIMKKVQRQTKGEYERNLYTTMDTLITACEGIFVLPADAEPGDKPQPLTLNGEGPLLFDERLAEWMGIEAQSARQTLLEFFANKETAIMVTGAKLARWQAGEDPATISDEWMLGEA